jgi:penicillin G amidase
MRILKYTIYFFVVIVVMFIAGLWLFVKIQSPKLSGELKLEGLKNEVRVHYDDYGIPHILAQNATDAYLALGYVHAQDRLFQMDLLRRVGGGRLSEFFGTKVLEVDKLFHTLGVPEYSKQSADLFKSQPAELQSLVNAYLAGINAFINTGATPLEYHLAGLSKENFEVVDMYQIAGYMAFSFAIGLRSDPLTENIFLKWGQSYLDDLALHHYQGQDLAPTTGASSSIQISSALIQQIDNLNVPLFFGSNNWVVSGSRTKSGKPIFANDTHIKFSQPSVWYESHLVYPGAVLYGNFLPGIPLALIGNNGFSAWGLTMLENDDTDFFYEELSADNSKVRYQDSTWVDIIWQDVDIKVKDGETIKHKIGLTPHGPLANEFFESPIDRSVSMFWTYTQKQNDLPLAFYQLNYSKSMAQSRNAASLIHAPGLNIAYADADNNIALWAAAHLLHRPEHVNPKRILDGISGKDEMLGYYPFSKNPQSENPVSGMVFSANSQHDSVGVGLLHEGYYVSTARMNRIKDLLHGENAFDIEMMKPIISDHFAMADLKIAQRVASVLEKESSAELKAYAELLMKWDGGHLISQKEPVAYYPLLYYLIKNTFADEMGDENFEIFLGTHLMKRSYHKLFGMDSSVWFDNVNTEDVEMLEDIVLQSSKMALDQLKTAYGDLSNIPDWGSVHTIEFPHAMGAQEPLDKIFNIGPFATSGTNESIDQQAFRLTGSGEYPVQHGPQMRILIDLEDFENSISINPTGQSGNVGSKHYGNQAKMFVNHQFRKQMMNVEEIKEKCPDVLILSPR